ncbi:hypothetical protein ACHHYP_03650 [Achlya hypogyna]|uniref:Uncharacterized protein n=1 Tax=Achlya hypogyna TaxID=1202772 RepID=A0A1V9Z3B5_ACHHY|nr:hypothetical protein ACHHYP_03650 [Achlya hypogyna]
MQRRPSMTSERLEVVLHDTCDAMGKGEAPRSELWRSFVVESLGASNEQFAAVAACYGVPDEMAVLAQEIVTARKPDIHRYLIRQAMTLAPAHLAGFDYSVRLVMTSGSLHGEMYPVLVLMLLIQEANGPPREVRLELRKDEVDKVLLEFETIEKTLAAVGC